MNAKITDQMCRQRSQMDSESWSPALLYLELVLLVMAFVPSALGQLTVQQQSLGGLDLGSDPLVVVGQARGFGGDTLEDVVVEAVHD